VRTDYVDVMQCKWNAQVIEVDAQATEDVCPPAISVTATTIAVTALMKIRLLAVSTIVGLFARTNNVNFIIEVS